MATNDPTLSLEMDIETARKFLPFKREEHRKLLEQVYRSTQQLDALLNFIQKFDGGKIAATPQMVIHPPATYTPEIDANIKAMIEATRQREYGAARKAIIEMLYAHPEGLKTEALQGSIKSSTSTLYRNLKELYTEGLIEEGANGWRVCASNEKITAFLARRPLPPATARPMGGLPRPPRPPPPSPDFHP